MRFIKKIIALIKSLFCKHKNENNKECGKIVESVRFNKSDGSTVIYFEYKENSK